MSDNRQSTQQYDEDDVDVDTTASIQPPPQPRQQDWYAHKSRGYDTLEHELQAQSIADALLRRLPPLHKNVHLLELGAGTGLLTQELARYVGRITAVDTSPAMLEVFQTKTYGCDIAILQVDLLENDSVLQQEQFDGVVSAMTLAHIANLDQLFAKLAAWVVPHGFIALADFDRKDEMMNTDNNNGNGNLWSSLLYHDVPPQGVFHRYGLDRMQLARLAAHHGFQDIVIQTVHTVKKRQGEFPIFMLTAVRMG